MAGQSAAKGSIALSLDATALDKGWKKSAADTKKAGSELAKTFNSSANEQIGAAFGGTSIIASGAKAGAIGAAVAAVAALGKSLWDAYGPLKDVNKELEYGAELNKKWFERVNQNVAVSREWINTLKDVAGTAAGMRQIASEARGIDFNVEAATARLKGVEQQLEGLDSNFSLTNWARWITGTHETTVNGIKAQADAAKSSLEGLKKQQEEVQREMRRIRNPETNPEAVAAVRQFVRDMEGQAAAARGVSSEMARLIQLQERYGLNGNMVRAASRAIAEASMAKDLAETRKAGEDAADTIRRLSEELGLLAKKSAEEQQLEEFIKKGIDEGQIARLRQLIGLRQQLNQQYKPNTAIVAGTAGEINFRESNRFQQGQEAERKRQLELQQQGNGWLGRIYQAVVGLQNQRQPAEF